MAAASVSRALSLDSISSSSTCSTPLMMPRTLSRLAAGHASAQGQGIWVASPRATGTSGSSQIMKAFDAQEHATYEALAAQYADDSIHPWVPGYYGVREESPHVPTKCIALGNKLQPFQRGKVMDVKIGLRTFAETECGKTDPREDLFAKMVEMYPDEVTPTEHVEGAITKHRWMTVRDRCSTISNLGLRVDGVAGYVTVTQDELRQELNGLRTREQVLHAFMTFASLSVSGDDPESDDGGCFPGGRAGGTKTNLASPTGRPLQVARSLLRQLRNLRADMAASSFVGEHEFIGSSLLLIADHTGLASVTWIDFAKTLPLPEGIHVSHDRPWVPGNHEDGIFVGLDNMIDLWNEVVDRLASDDTPSAIERESSIQFVSVRSRATSSPLSASSATRSWSPTRMTQSCPLSTVAESAHSCGTSTVCGTSTWGSAGAASTSQPPLSWRRPRPDSAESAGGAATSKTADTPAAEQSSSISQWLCPALAVALTALALGAVSVAASFRGAVPVPI